MASLDKPGGPPKRDVLDRLMQEYRPKKELQEAIGSGESVAFDVKVLVVRLIDAERMTPTHRRLGMERIAWIYGVSPRSAREWWEAYKRGGVDALRNGTRRPRPTPGAGLEVAEEAAAGLERRGSGAAGGEKEEGGRVAVGSKGGKCPCCLAAAGAPHAGRAGGKGPVRGGRQQAARAARCRCMAGGRRKRAGAGCRCADAGQCGCQCSGPARPSPPGPPRAAGRPALRAAPSGALLPEEFGEAIRKKTGVVYSRNHLYTLLAGLGLSPRPAAPPA